MRANQLLFALLIPAGVALPGVASARHDVNVGAHVAPPPFVAVPVRQPEYVWVPGSWAWNRGRHVWLEGHWVLAQPGPGRVSQHRHYSGPYWDDVDDSAQRRASESPLRNHAEQRD